AGQPRATAPTTTPSTWQPATNCMPARPPDEATTCPPTAAPRAYAPNLIDAAVVTTWVRIDAGECCSRTVNVDDSTGPSKVPATTTRTRARAKDGTTERPT